MAAPGILIVEDETLFAQHLAEILRDAGYEIVGMASTADDALQQALSVKPDLVIMDVVLKGDLDGIEAARHIRSHVDTAIIFVTAHSDEHFFERARTTGPYSYVAKPVSPLDLTRNVEMVLDRHRMEQRLRRSEQRLELALHGADLGLWDWDIPSGEHVLSRRSLEIIGNSPGQRVPDLRMWLDRVHPEDFDAFVGSLESHLRGLTPSFELEYRIRSEEGEWKWIRSQGKVVQSDEFGNPVRVIGTHLDVTHRRRAEQELRESEQRYRQLTQNSLTGIYILQDGRFAFVNDRLAHMTGYTPQEMIHNSFWDFIAPEDKDAVRARAAAAREQETYQFRSVCKNGERKWLEVLSAPIVHEGRPASMGNVADISYRKRAEDAIRNIVIGVSGETGKAFFDSTVVQFAKMLDADYTLIGEQVEMEDGPRIRTLSFCSDFQLSSNLSYPLEGSPCDVAIHDGICSHPSGAAELFPQDKALSDLGIQGYVGVGLFDSNHDPIGIMSAMYKNPVGDVDFAESILQIFASRAAAEINRIRAEAALRRSESRYRRLFEDSLDAIVTSSREGQIVDVNRSFLELFGYPRDELDSLPASRLWEHPEERSEWQKQLELANSVKDYPMKAMRKDGQVRDCLMTSHVRVAEDGSVQYQSICRDVTEQKKAQEALQESVQMFRLLSEQSLLSVAVLQDGVYKYANQAMAVLSDYSVEELLNWAPEEFLKVIHPEDRSFVMTQAGMKQEGDERQTTNYIFRMSTKWGETKWVEIYSKTVQFQGRPADLITMLDISDRERAEEQLRQAAKMEAIGHLAGGVAHDFNNLLTGMIGFSEMLMEELPKTGPYHERLLQITRAAERAAGLTQQLLAFGRKQVLEMRPLDLNFVIEDFEKMLRRLIGENIGIEKRLAPDLKTVKADKGQVEQILMNLAINARDAMPGGGLLTIETFNTVLDSHVVRAHPDVEAGEYVMMAVSDTGHGMDPDTVPRIFDPFFTTKGKGVGTGLGLSTVYGIVKQHRGHVTVYSEPGRGTTFRVYLPLMEQVSYHTSITSPMQSRSEGTETILVVEDEQVVRDLACEALGMLGYKALSACDPNEAITISHLHRGRIDLLLSDVVLPQMDGRSLFNKLAVSRPEMKVLFVSGYTENFIVHHGVLDQGVNFLQKPFTVERLGHKVREVLDAPGASVP